jgi:hypothetical protein
MGFSVRPSAIGLLLFACSCAPLTYSEEGATDFETYASVRVTVASTSTGSDAAGYLARELQQSSGFETVTLDPAAQVDAVLGVTLEVVFSPTVDDQGQSIDQYSATADYALTASSSRVDSGVATANASTDVDAAESALDGVVTHYVAPYRL